MTVAIDHRCCVVNSNVQLTATSWTDLLIEVESLIYGVSIHGRAYLVLRVERPDDPFVQFTIDSLGRVHVEATGTLRHGDHRDRLGAGQEHTLTRLGWRAPHDEADGWRPDGAERHLVWWRERDPRWVLPEPLFAELFVRTLVEVYGVAGPELVRVRVGNMPRDGRPGRRAGDTEREPVALSERPV